jgi:hypothetical protein
LQAWEQAFGRLDNSRRDLGNRTLSRFPTRAEVAIKQDRVLPSSKRRNGNRTGRFGAN